MITNEQKILRFAGEAVSEARKRAEEIMAEVGGKRSSLLSESGRKIEDEAKSYIEEELKKLRRKNTREVSVKTMELRSEVLKRREEILEGVMDEVAGRLRKFAETEELYGGYLENLCLGVISHFGSSCVVYLSSGDADRYGKRILDRLASVMADSVFTVLPDDSIKIGGAKFHSPESSIFINETLDANLEMQREQFTSMMISAMRRMSSGKKQK